MPNQALSRRDAVRYLSRNPRKSRRIQAFQVFFDARSHVAVLPGKRYRTAKIRCRAAGAPQGRRHAGPRQGQIHRRFHPARPGLCWMVRSSHAHGIIKGIDTAAAKAMPGVLGVWTGKDLDAAGYNPFTCGLPLKSRDGSPLLQTNRPALATDKVRFVGDPVAFVVAETLAQARDAAEAVELDIEPLPAVTDAAEATKPGAPQLYDHIPNNVALDYHYGDTAKIDAAFAAAAHVTKLDIVNTRVAVVVDGAARGACGLRQGERALHAAGADPGRRRQQGRLCQDPERAERQGSYSHRQCRRLLRHEEHQLSRIHLHPARGEGAGPSGEMDRRALDQLPVRQPGPRAAHPRRTRARCRRQVPRGAPPGLRQSRRLHHRRGAGAAVAQHRQEPRQRLPHAAARRRHQDGADQHHADGRLSRRRPARGQLLHGAADRPRRRRDGHQPADAAQAQFHQAGANAVRGGLRRHL